ncbi:PREDICTED: uncharacterized protein LOC109582420 isoform X2 [Amphimedon queenslandica]|uniref:Uncharacterized protein n=2 Tax=Amphimedon queenslandica TaxID=400682 RepID=A0AAN0J7F9_AMPQE|nr:PREDICTED: uncharacterized protein LOC109582420 isoform X2 [Amphimedon queenslandica]|eukprot:XP_019852671.1 PREDICTED: uncharacterized protein LOC109582420 isoform X2 [Amphimedon queenslandica]
MIEEKQVEIKALQFSLSNATERGNIAAEENKELNERIETQLRISRAKDQKIEDLKAAAIREKIEMTKTEKDYELQIEALKTAMKENEKIIEQSGIKDLSIIIREKDKAIAELQELIMGGNLEASSDPESQIKYLNIIIREKDKTIAELQHLDEMAHLEESSDSDYVPHSRHRPKEIKEHNDGFMRITNPSLKACQDVITKLKNSKNFLYPLLEELSPGATRLLIPAILNARNVKKLTIRRTPLTSDFILSLSSQLSSNESIWSLDFNYDTIDDDGVIALVHSLKDNTRVIDLGVSYTSGITSVSVQPLKELILTNKTLGTLSITNTSIDTDGVLSLIETLQTNKRISIVLSKQHEQACSSLPYYDTIKKRLYFI